MASPAWKDKPPSIDRFPVALFLGFSCVRILTRYDFIAHFPPPDRSVSVATSAAATMYTVASLVISISRIPTTMVAVDARNVIVLSVRSTVGTSLILSFSPRLMISGRGYFLVESSLRSPSVVESPCVVIGFESLPWLRIDRPHAPDADSFKLTGLYVMMKCLPREP
jgi:hypothetical protein